MALSDYINGINQRLTDAQAGGDPLLAGASIQTEDVGELEQTINTEIARTGLLILIGQPGLQNTRQSLRTGVMTIGSRIEVGENPTLWRDGTKPVSQDIAEHIAQLVQGFVINGFKSIVTVSLNVELGKKGQLWTLELESELIIQKTS